MNEKDSLITFLAFRKWIKRNQKHNYNRLRTFNIMNTNVFLQIFIFFYDFVPP